MQLKTNWLIYRPMTTKSKRALLAKHDKILHVQYIIVAET